MYKVISLFSGCGGSSLGYKMAGMDVLVSNEFVPAAIDTYKANHPGTIVLEDDIRTLTADKILETAGLKVGELDVLDASPPCQAFSMMGKREEKWGKSTAYSDTKQRTDDLFFEFARILKGVQPKTFVAENVSGLVMGKAKEVFDEVYRTLEDCGYKVSARILNAKYFGVAQNRPRLIFVGVRKDLNVEASHPMPQTAPTPIKDVLHGLTLTDEDLAEAMYPAHYSVIPLMNQMKPGEKGSDYHPNGSYFGLARLDFDKPANTILQSDAKHISCSALHPTENRKLTIKELKRVASFPDDFILTGKFAQQWERIGRAVPPLMMKAIASHIRYKILDKVNNIENDYSPTKFNFVVPEGQEQFDVCEGNDFREYTPAPIDKMKEYKQDSLL